VAALRAEKLADRDEGYENRVQELQSNIQKINQPSLRMEAQLQELTGASTFAAGVG
jgi:hypothetical protein